MIKKLFLLLFFLPALSLSQEKNLAEKLGLGKTTYWLRLNKDNSIRLTVEKTTKEDWLWVQ